MEIPNYDFNEDENTNFKQLYKYMPDKPFRMLICGNSGSGKTNLLYYMLMKPLLFYDEIHLYGKNLKQEKYKHMIETMNDISRQVYCNIKQKSQKHLVESTVLHSGRAHVPSTCAQHSRYAMRIQ